MVASFSICTWCTKSFYRLYRCILTIGSKALFILYIFIQSVKMWTYKSARFSAVIVRDLKTDKAISFPSARHVTECTLPPTNSPFTDTWRLELQFSENVASRLTLSAFDLQIQNWAKVWDSQHFTFPNTIQFTIRQSDCGWQTMQLFVQLNMDVKNPSL